VLFPARCATDARCDLRLFGLITLRPLSTCCPTLESTASSNHHSPTTVFRFFTIGPPTCTSAMLYTLRGNAQRHARQTPNPGPCRGFLSSEPDAGFPPQSQAAASARPVRTLLAVRVCGVLSPPHVPRNYRLGQAPDHVRTMSYISMPCCFVSREGNRCKSKEGHVAAVSQSHRPRPDPLAFCALRAFDSPLHPVATYLYNLGPAQTCPAVREACTLSRQMCSSDTRRRYLNCNIFSYSESVYQAVVTPIPFQHPPNRATNVAKHPSAPVPSICQRTNPIGSRRTRTLASLLVPILFEPVNCQLPCQYSPEYYLNRPINTNSQLRPWHL
jgi:hypothetical protein